MPSHAIRVLRLAGAAFVVAAFAGCGTAMAADGSPLWTTAPAATHASGTGGGAPAPKAPSASASASASVSASAKPAHSSAPSAPQSSAPADSTAGRPRFDGPANSATRTGSAGVALTFDDGPDPVQTPKILDLLAQRHVKATFCLVGQNVVAHPDLVRRIVAEGHTLCNHTWRHSLTLGKQQPAVIRADLRRTNDAIRAAAPGVPIKYMRAPGGNFTPNFVKVAADLGMTSIYWQVDPRDWDHPKGESDAAHRAKVLSAIKAHVHKGSIVLSHDFGQPDTIAAYRALIPWLQQRYQHIALP
jgi:peptidoglycan/xylan/chitin deacetylase (PgdA/CDA1 family)